MSAYRLALAAYLVLLLFVPTALLVAQTKTKGPIRRAQPPKFTKTDPFFENAFESALQGERPADLSKAVAARPATGGNPSATDPNDPPPTSGGSGWASLISPTTLEDEIKAQKIQADMNVTTPSAFAGQGKEDARRDFSMVAVIFAIIAEYDGDVRWKKEAPSQRDQFARTAANAKVGTTSVYNEAKLRKQDLADLIGGQSVEIKDAEPQAKWGELVNRSPLMQRMEASHDAKIKAWSSSDGEFKSNLEKLQHEAQIFAVIGEVLKKDGMEDADDEEYRKFAVMLIAGGKELAQACEDKNQAAASKAASTIAQSCDKCHESYR